MSSRITKTFKISWEAKLGEDWLTQHNFLQRLIEFNLNLPEGVGELKLWVTEIEEQSNAD